MGAANPINRTATRIAHQSVTLIDSFRNRVKLKGRIKWFLDRFVSQKLSPCNSFPPSYASYIWIGYKLSIQLGNQQIILVFALFSNRSDSIALRMQSTLIEHLETIAVNHCRNNLMRDVPFEITTSPNDKQQHQDHQLSASAKENVGRMAKKLF